MMPTSLGTKLVAVLLVLTPLAACGGTKAGGVSDDSPKGSNATSEEATPSKTPTPTPKAMPKLGQSYTWDDGLSVTISKPRPFRLSAEGYVEKKHAAYVIFDVTIVNKTGKPYDASAFSTTLQSGDTEAEEAFDGGNDLNGSPGTTLLDGRQARFKIGYGVSNVRDLVLDIGTGIYDDTSGDEQAATFTN